MSERMCRTCHFYAGRNSYPHFGTCGLINASGDPASRPVRIRPAGDAWLEVRDTFVCGQHFPKPKKTGETS